MEDNSKHQQQLRLEEGSWRLLVACLLPLLVLYATVRILDLKFTFASLSDFVREVVFGSRPSPTYSPSSSSSKTTQIKTATTATTSTSHPFSRSRAVNSYASYLRLSRLEIESMVTSYSKLKYAHKRIGYEVVGYPEKLKKLREVTDVNARVTSGVVGLAKEEGEGDEGVELDSSWRRTWWTWTWWWTSFSTWRDILTSGHDQPQQPDLGRVRESLKHFVRDWSEEGEEERKRMFELILDVLRRDDGGRGKEKGKKKRVLVPGSGLGRLAWEISELGYETTAIEFSYFMTLAFRFLLSPKTTQRPNQHIVHPYAYWFSHSRTSEVTFRGVTFPDVVPRLGENFRLVEGDFFAHTAVNGSGGSSGDDDDDDNSKGYYDYVVTLFFIDTSINIIATLEHIYALLKPGGTWINLGPLLWTGGAQARMELSLEEVVKLAEAVGFGFLEESVEATGGDDGGKKRKTRAVECEYTADKMAMMKWLYQAEFWVATKL